MNFTNLTTEELESFFNMYSVVPIGDPHEYATQLFNSIGVQGTFPEPVVDLYIASQLKGKVQVPLDYNIDVLTSKSFLKIPCL